MPPNTILHGWAQPASTNIIIRVTTPKNDERNSYVPICLQDNRLIIPDLAHSVLAFPDEELPGTAWLFLPDPCSGNRQCWEWPQRCCSPGQRGSWAWMVIYSPRQHLLSQTFIGSKPWTYTATNQFVKRKTIAVHQRFVTTKTSIPSTLQIKLINHSIEVN